MMQYNSMYTQKFILNAIKEEETAKLVAIQHSTNDQDLIQRELNSFESGSIVVMFMLGLAMCFMICAFFNTDSKRDYKC